MTTRTTVTIPDGLDLSDRNVRQKIELSIKKKLGSTFEVLWPRPKDKTRDVVAVDSRPGLKKVSLGSDVKQSSGPAVFAKLRTMGLQMVEFDPYGGFALACTMDEQTVKIRNKLAAVLKCDPWALEIVCDSIFDEKLGRDRLDKVCIVKIPSQGISAEKRTTLWHEIIPMLDDGSNGWVVEEDTVSNQIQLSYGPKKRLPDLVPLESLMPTSLNLDAWAKIPLGIDAEGHQVCTNLESNVHGVYAGPTGTGKTILLLTHAVGALARGHRLIMIDAIKAGLDFQAIQPWCSGWADDLESAQVMIEAVYAEVTRRKVVLTNLEGVDDAKVSDVSPEVQRRYQLFPMTVIIDEYASMVMEEAVHKSLPKDSPYRVEAEARNAHRAVIATVVGNIAREARFAQIHLVLALQRADASITGGNMRSNLTHAVQLAPPGKPISREALTMLFPGDTGPQAAAALSELDDGESRGLAVMAAEGGTVTGFRVAYTKKASEIPPLLEAVPVPLPTPFIVKPSQNAPAGDPAENDKENF